MDIGMIAVWLKIDEKRVVQALQEAQARLDEVEGEVALDFSSVARIDPAALAALERFAIAAADKGVNVTLRGVDVGVYKVLKLVKLESRFLFVS
jgi:ABC-type transporter Mla MlaB component